MPVVSKNQTDQSDEHVHALQFIGGDRRICQFHRRIVRRRERKGKMARHCGLPPSPFSLEASAEVLEILSSLNQELTV